MTMFLLPETQGVVVVGSDASKFVDTFCRRVAGGLLSGKPHPRSNYVVTEVGTDRLHVSAADWWTAINVGLNELDVQFERSGTLRYQVRYWRWALYALVLSGSLGLIGVLALIFFDLRAYVTHFPERMVPGPSVDANLAIAWAMVLFWGFVWPWLLILLHKRPLRRLATRLITEVDAEALRLEAA